MPKQRRARGKRKIPPVLWRAYNKNVWKRPFTEYLSSRKNRAAILRRDMAHKSKVPHKFSTWYKHPNRYDWPGIDLPGTYRRGGKYSRKSRGRKKKAMY